MSTGLTNQERLSASTRAVRSNGNFLWFALPFLAGLVVSIPLLHLLLGESISSFYLALRLIVQDNLGMTDSRFFSKFDLDVTSRQVKAAHNFFELMKVKVWSVAATQAFVTIGLIVWNPFERKKKASQKRLASAEHYLVSPKELVKEIKNSAKKDARFKPSELDFYVPGIKGLRIPAVNLSTMMGLLGDSGAGKTTLLRQFVDSRKANREKCFVLDINGEYSSVFCKPGDVILSLFDTRATRWDMWNEDIPFEEIASAINETVEQGVYTSSAADFFNTASHVVLTSLLNASDSEESLWKLATLDRDSLVQLLLQMPGIAKQMIGKGTDGQTLGVIATALRKLAPFEHLNRSARIREQKTGIKEEAFSISKWVNDENDRRTVFIVTTDASLDQAKPLLRIWITILAKTLMARSEMTSSEKVYLVADELESIGKIPKLHQFLTTMRRKGGAAVLGFHSIDQLVNIYGQVSADLIIQGIQNIAIYRVQNPAKAKYMAEFLGKIEVIDHVFTQSLDKKTNQYQPGISESVREKWVISPEMISRFDDGEVILRLARFSPCKLRFSNVEFPKVCGVAKKYEEIPSHRNEYKKALQALEKKQDEPLLEKSNSSTRPIEGATSIDKAQEAPLKTAATLENNDASNQRSAKVDANKASKSDSQSEGKKEVPSVERDL